MKQISNILLKVLVARFYQRNSGFFLFLFVVLFGVAQNPKQYHVQLMTAIVSSPTTLLVALALWLLYNVKCLLFIQKTIHDSNNAFFKELQCLPTARLFGLFWVIETMLFAPVWIYALFTIYVGISLKYYISSSIIIAFIVGIQLVSAWLYSSAIFRHGGGLQLPSVQIPIKKKFWAILLWHSLFTGKLKITVVKFFSFCLLFIPLVWNGDHFQLSDFVLFFQVCIAAHAVVVYDCVQFLEKRFSIIRNMPIRRYKIFLLYVVVYLWLLLPEAAILAYYSTKMVMDVKVGSLMIYFFGQLLFYTSIAYEKQMNMGTYLGAVGLITVCLLMVLPFANFWIIGLALIGISFIVFHSLYYKYETQFLVE